MNKELNDNELMNVNGGSVDRNGPIASGGIHVWSKP